MQLTRHTMAGAVALLSLIALAPAGAQDTKAPERGREERRVEIRRGPGGVYVARTAAPRAVLGVTIGASGNLRDTLGVLVSMLSDDGPAEKAGIEEGDRIQAINGVSLRLSAADADDEEMAGLGQRRLTRELAKVKPGDDVELRVLHANQVRTVRVKTANSEEFYKRASAAVWRDEQENRAALGIAIGSTGSRRDTLGVLVTGADDEGPAAKAGIFEGARIAEINGVNLRVAKEDVEDGWASSSRAQRLQRELRKVKAGDNVTLRVWQDGQYRTVQVKTVKASELPRRRMMFIGDGIAPMPPMPPMPAMAPMAPRPPMPEIRLEGLRELEQRLPELRLRLDGMREQLRMMPRGRMLVSV
ncbi:MAG TPA: PDZ domain-containing protein [Gemmatimonadaceae bacterium]